MPELLDDSEEDGSLRNILSLNGVLLVAFLGAESSGIAALALSAQTFQAAVAYTLEVYQLVGSGVHPLRPVLGLIGGYVVGFLGPEENGLLALRCASGTFRWGVVFAVEDYYEDESPSSSGSSEEPTVSGHTTETSSTSISSVSFSDNVQDLHAGESGDETSAGGHLPSYLDDHVAPTPEEEHIPSPHDIAVAQAAFLLYQQGFDFAWEQLTEAQQDVYHALVGNWLMQLPEID